MQRTWADILWGKHAKVGYLWVAAVLMLLTSLGYREIWTQEHRWADIVYGMIYSKDYLHPSLGGVDYYDKPLLSYWLIIAVASFIGKLTTVALRLPSALAGLLAIGSIYSLGKNLKDQKLGLLAGWMLLTTFYFIFWARTSSADMLNLAGTLFAVAWYVAKRANPRFFDYMIFFLILAVSALCKGLVAPMVALIVIFPDVLLQKKWRNYLNWQVLLSTVPALIVYALPFWASAHFSQQNYSENGLMLVYRENILRYFQPFDHQGPIYTYFIFLPIYLLPWTFFFIPALISLKSRWKSLSANSKWMVYSTVLLFIFFTLSGSRRNYYVLPMVPFAILMTADWILATLDTFKRNRWAGWMAIGAFLIFFLNFDVVQPMYYAQSGMDEFTQAVTMRAEQIKPWSQWRFVMLDPESKVRFYLDLSPTIKNYSIPGALREDVTVDTLLKEWPFLQNANSQTNIIYISRKLYEPELKMILKNYTVIETHPGFMQKKLHKDMNMPIAFIPN